MKLVLIAALLGAANLCLGMLCSTAVVFERMSDSQLANLAQNNGDSVAEATLVERYDQLVKASAQKFSGIQSQIDAEELTSPAFEGVLIAVRTFPLDGSVEFYNHAYRNVRFALCKYLRFHIKRLKPFITSGSLNAKKGNSQSDNFFDWTADPDWEENSPSSQMETQEVRDVAHQMLSELPDDLVQILRLRHGFDGPTHTRPEIEAITGRKKVSRIEYNAYADLSSRFACPY